MNAFLNSEDVCGQKRTGKTKKYVVFKPSTPEVVYKGPYAADGSDKRYNTTCGRAISMIAWGTPHVVLPRGAVEFDRIFETSSPCKVTAIRFENIQGQFPEESEKYTEKTGNISYKVATKLPFVKLSDYLPKDNESLLTKSLLRAFVHLFVLHIGDMGLWNVLSDGKTVHIVDYEDTNQKEYLEDPIFFFNRKPAVKYQMYETFRSMYADMAEEISDLDISVIPANYMTAEEASKRKNLAITLLKRFSSDPAPEQSIPLSVEPEPSGPSSGKMVFNGMRASTTFHGHTPSLIKSALQKNIRRGNYVQAVYCALELHMFTRVKGMPLVHNLYNRLAVIACEDVSPRNITLAAYVAGWNVEWIHKKSLTFLHKKDTLLPKDSDVYSVPRLIGVIRALCEASKSRISSHLWKAYTDPEGILLLKNTGKASVDSPNFEKSCTKWDNQDFLEKKVKYLLPTDYDLEDGRLALMAIMIYNRLKEGRRNAITWIGLFLDYIKDKKINVKTRHGRRRPDILIWEVYAQFLPDTILRPLRDAYYTLSESRPFLMCPASHILYRNGKEPDLDLNIPSTQIDSYAFGNEGLDKPLDVLVNGDYTLVIEDYMVDKHTGKKGNAKDLKKLFVREGAKVENQDPVAHDPLLQEIYETV